MSMWWVTKQGRGCFVGDMTMVDIVLEQDIQDSFQQQHIKAMFVQLFCEIYIESPINSIIEGYRNEVRVCPFFFFFFSSSLYLMTLPQLLRIICHALGKYLHSMIRCQS